MIWQANPYAVPDFCAAALCLGLVAFMRGRRLDPAATSFTILLLLIAEWATADGLASISVDLPSMLFWDMLLYVGAVSVPAAYLVFVLEHTGRQKFLSGAKWLLPFVLPILALLLRWTNDYHHLFYTENHLVTSEGLLTYETTFGVAFYLYAAYSYVLVLAGLALLGQRFLRSLGVQRRQSAILILGVIVPVGASVLDVLGPTTYPFNWTPLAFAFTGLCFYWAVFHFRLFQFMPVAHEAIFQGMADGVLVLDQTGHIVSINPAAEAIFGCGAAEVAGKSATELLDSRRLERKGLATESTDIALTVAGTRRDFSVSFSPLRDVHGRHVGQIGVMRDITERKRMEDALRESEARFRELADLLPQIVFETDEKGILTYFNRVGLTLTGYTEGILHSGFDASMAFSPEELPKVVDGFQRVLAGEKRGPREYHLRRKDGTSFPVMIQATAVIRNGKPVGLRGIIIDMTERKQMEEDLVRSKQLASVGETAAMVGHDLRNPLQATASSLYLARKLLASGSEADGKEALGLLQKLDSQISYMDKIVSDLQDYARPLGAEPIETDLRLLIRDVISDAKIPTDIQVSTVIQDGLTRTMIDPLLMRRVLANLTLNAVQAMPNGGALTITATRTHDSTVLTVQDTGVGIPKENLDRIFNPFFTTKAQGQGLGLPVCKRLVEAQGGIIEIKSETGKGSIFTVRVPSVKAA